MHEFLFRTRITIILRKKWVYHIIGAHLSQPRYHVKGRMPKFLVLPVRYPVELFFLPTSNPAQMERTPKV
jgi:hypothetical protein